MMPDHRHDPPDPSATLTREQRLAAKLRENLRRRKAQAPGLAQKTDTLPKSPGKS